MIASETAEALQAASCCCACSLTRSCIAVTGLRSSALAHEVPSCSPCLAVSATRHPPLGRRHPAAGKALIAKTVANATGAKCTSCLTVTDLWGAAPAQ